jgi:hypothetical protein
VGLPRRAARTDLPCMIRIPLTPDGPGAGDGKEDTLTPGPSATAPCVALPPASMQSSAAGKGGYHAESRPLGWSDIAPELDPETGEIIRQQFPDGTRIEREIDDDTLPGGPRKKLITYLAPFDRCDREADYRLAWQAFEERQQDQHGRSG